MDFVTWILSLCMFFSLATVEAQETRHQWRYEEMENSINRYIYFFHSTLRETLREKYIGDAKKMIPYILKYSEKYNVDPMLVACIISFESSWRNFGGDLGEFGPMHVMPSKWSNQFDTDTLDGQLEAGIARLRLAHSKCITLEKSLTHYASGRCVSKSELTKKKIRYRMRYYMKVKKRFGANDISTE